MFRVMLSLFIRISVEARYHLRYLDHVLLAGPILHLALRCLSVSECRPRLHLPLRPASGYPPISLRHLFVFIGRVVEDLDDLLLLLDPPLPHQCLIRASIVPVKLALLLLHFIGNCKLLLLGCLLELDAFSIKGRGRLVKALVGHIVIAGGVFHHRVDRGVPAKFLFHLIIQPLLLLQFLLLLNSTPLRITVFGGLVLFDFTHQTGKT